MSSTKRFFLVYVSLIAIANSVHAGVRASGDSAVGVLDALGNIIGSNLFNTLAVVGIAALIEPMAVDAVVLSRDWTLMFGLTVALLVLGIGIKKAGQINRLEGALLLTVFFGYTGYLISSAF